MDEPEKLSLVVTVSCKNPKLNGRKIDDQGNGPRLGPWGGSLLGDDISPIKEIFEGVTRQEWEAFVDSILGEDYPENLMALLVGDGRGSIPTVKWAVLSLLDGYALGEPPEGTLVSRVEFPLFEMKCNPEIPLSQIRERRFDLLDRVIKLNEQDQARATDISMMEILEAQKTFDLDLC
jgi:hypothetical protein